MIDIRGVLESFGVASAWETRFGVKCSAANGMSRLCIYINLLSTINDRSIHTCTTTSHIMGEDTPQSSQSPSNDVSATEDSAPWRKKSKHDFPKTQAGKMWEAFGNPADPINEMPGGTYNSAGGKPKEITWKDVFDWKFSDVKRFYRVPCARDALLVGLVGGASVGGLTTIIGGKMDAVIETRLLC